jgi:hypothetical protein
LKQIDLFRDNPIKSAKLRFDDRSEHDQSVAEAELSVSDGSVLIGHDQMLLKAESPA